MKDAALSDVDVTTLVSRHTGESYRVLVARPADPPDAPLPVVALDATVSFGTLVEVTRLLQFSGDLPPLLVVGIGYQERRFGDALGPRQRDLTFSRSASGGWPDDPRMMGGGRQFADFLEDELKGWVTGHYAVNGDDWGILGSSLGGLFLTHVLFDRPRSFQRYGIGSPSYWWNDMAIFEVEAASVRDGDPTARVAITVGEYEQPEGRARYVAGLSEPRRSAAMAEDEEFLHPDMVRDAERMYSLLRGHPSLGVSFEVIAGEYHQTVIPAHLSRAVRSLYEGPL